MAKKDFKADALGVLDLTPQQYTEPTEKIISHADEKKTVKAVGEKIENEKEGKIGPGRPKKNAIPTQRFTLLLSDANNCYIDKIKKIQGLAGYEVINKILDEHRQANEPVLDEAIKQMEKSLKSWKL